MVKFRVILADREENSVRKDGLIHLRESITLGKAVGLEVKNGEEH